MDFKYIVVQAGGKGTRMQHLTRNKPKALVPINNLPIIFHLFKKYPDKNFIVIGDYKCDVLQKYLSAFAKVSFTVVNAKGKNGTCGGLTNAIKEIPDKESFMLIWSDLILNDDFDIKSVPAGNYVGTSLGYECRWKYENNSFFEERSSTCGVAGMFIFENKSILEGIPEEGEFVKWLAEKNIDFKPIILDKTKEYGLLSEYNKLEINKCRPFNRIIIEGDTVIKEGIDEQGQNLAIREKAWYQKTKSLGYKNIPKIYSIDPLKIERINGKNIYEYTNIPLSRKKAILQDVVKCLKELHGLGESTCDKQSFYNAYLKKTFDRLDIVKDLVPFAKDDFIIINGQKCRNVFNLRDMLISEINNLMPEKYVFIHGDCTFSNIMLKNDNEPILIDPRGYFGNTELYGDPAYDWAKLYYSLMGNYDQFNLKKFDLNIEDDNIQLNIESSGWEELEGYFFELLSDEVSIPQIKLIHSIIWLSLTTYAWQDYDSICGAFYNGLLYLEDVL